MSLLILFGGAAETVVPRDPVVTPIIRRTQAGGVSVTTNLLLTVLAAASVTAPVGQASQEAPVARQQVQVQSQQHNLLTSTLAAQEVVQAPFFVTDWPVPRGARHSRPQVHFRGEAFDPTKPGLQTDWPNPVLAKIPAHEPGFSTLALRETPVAAPFVSREVGSPQARPAAQQDPGSRASLPLAQPFSQDDWPTPLATLKAWHDPGRSALALTEVQAPVQAPLVQRDWPAPIARPAPQHEAPQSRLALTFVQPPFAQADWPVPRAAVALKPQIHFRSPEAEEGVPSGTPFSQSDWPAPRRRPTQQPGPVVNYLALGIPPGEPYYPQDAQWLNPAPRKWQQQPEGYVNRLALTTPPADSTKPFAQNDWQNPRGKFVFQRDDTIANLLLGYPTPPAVDPPFKPAQLPDPVTRRAVQQPGEATNFLSRFVPYAPQDSLWPNPVRAMQVQQPWAVQNPLLLGIPDAPVVTPVVFGNATAMPVVRKPSALQPSHGRGEPFDPTKPFHQDDWNVRYSLRWCQSIHDQQLNILLLGIPDPPVVVVQDSEWIIRARRRGRR